MSKAQREAAEAALRGLDLAAGSVAERRAQFAARIQPGDAAGLGSS